MIAGDELDLFERSISHATSNHTGEALDAALRDLGWLDALGDDPRTGISVLFEQQGRANATSSALDHVLLQALGVDSRVGVGAVLPVLGSGRPPGLLDAGGVSVEGLGWAGLAGCETIVAAATTSDGDLAVSIALRQVSVRRQAGIDPSLGLVELTGRADSSATRPTDWAAALRLGQLAVAHELVGAARRMLELAREHALERIQFGRPIATFQAVRHRLADTLIAIETADAALRAAWDDPSPVTAAMAKALAGRGARTAARHCQQVLAGIGFTTEHPFHRYLRRVLVLDQLLGAGRALTRELGEDVVRTRRLPRLPPL